MRRNQKSFGLTGKRQQLAKQISLCLWAAASSSRRPWSGTLGCTLTIIYPWKPTLVTVPRHVSSTRDESVSYVVISTYDTVSAHACTDTVTLDYCNSLFANNPQSVHRIVKYMHKPNMLLLNLDLVLTELFC